MLNTHITFKFCIWFKLETYSLEEESKQLKLRYNFSLKKKLYNIQVIPHFCIEV